MPESEVGQVLYVGWIIIVSIGGMVTLWGVAAGSDSWLFRGLVIAGAAFIWPIWVVILSMTALAVLIGQRPSFFPKGSLADYISARRHH